MLAIPRPIGVPVAGLHVAADRVAAVGQPVHRVRPHGGPAHAHTHPANTAGRDALEVGAGELAGAGEVPGSRVTEPVNPPTTVQPPVAVEATAIDRTATVEATPTIDRTATVGAPAVVEATSTIEATSAIEATPTVKTTPAVEAARRRAPGAAHAAHAAHAAPIASHVAAAAIATHVAATTAMPERHARPHCRRPERLHAGRHEHHHGPRAAPVTLDPSHGRIPRVVSCRVYQSRAAVPMIRSRPATPSNRSRLAADSAPGSRRPVTVPA